MKKFSNSYIIIWAIALVAFNVIAFVTVSNTIGLSQAGNSFWVAYAFITVAFLGNLLVSIKFFKEENKDKVFLNIPVIYLSFCALIVSLIAGAVAMAVPSIPYWVGIIVDVIIVAIYAILIVSARAAASAVQHTGEKVKAQTSFIRLLTADAETLKSRASADAKSLVDKVYEAIRYSDPMSSPQLNDIETQIKNEFTAFSDAIKNDDVDLATTSSDELINLVNDRNNKCKALK